MIYFHNKKTFALLKKLIIQRVIKQGSHEKEGRTLAQNDDSVKKIDLVKLLHTAEILNQKVFPPTPADCVKRCRGHLASQALGSGPETDMPNLLCIHLTCAFLRMHCHTKPLTKLMFGTDQKDFWPEFRTPFLSPLCLLFLHPAPCEVSDSFSLVSSIWQYVLEKKDKCSNRTYPFSRRGGRGKQTVFTPYFLLFVFVNKLESLDCFFSLIVRISGH